VIRFVVLDLGQVLASPPDLYRAPADLLGVDPEAYEARYWLYRRAYDAGGSEPEYWRGILEGVGVTSSDELIGTLAGLDAGMWAELRPGARRLLDTVRGWGPGMALLSNAPLTLGVAVRNSDWVQLFDRVFISAELGMTKPDPRIFDIVTADLGVGPEELAFIDDRPPNVAAAVAAGWNAHLWADDADSLAWLTEVCAP
jgi:putative hydrolase of the HAD superfamily